MCLNNYTWKRTTKLFFCGKKWVSNQWFHCREKSSKSLEKSFFEKKKILPAYLCGYDLQNDGRIFFFYIYNLHFFGQKTYSHQVLIYLNVPGIPVRKALQNRHIVSWRATECVSLGVICASLLTGFSRYLGFGDFKVPKNCSSQ